MTPRWHGTVSRSGWPAFRESRSSPESLGSVRQLQPHAVVIAVQMHNGRGIDLVQRMRRIVPAPCVIVLTNEACPEVRNRCLAGADYFFDKSTEYQEMVTLPGTPFTRSGAH